LQRLFEGYQREGLVMPYTMDDFRRDYVKEHFKDLTAEERQEALRGLTPAERLQGLPPEVIEEYLNKLKAADTPRPRRHRKDDR
jgi:hypothetical protein